MSTVPRSPILWVIGAFVVGLAVVVGAFFAIQTIFAAPQPPKQPIRFPHNFHVQVVGLDCTFCHRTAATEAAAGVPAVEQCMFCHQVAGLQNPEVQKVIAAYNEGRPIDWVRVHRMPDHVRFLHAPHIQAGVPCSTCHGEVQNMVEVAQVRPLNMRDCVDCHKQTVVQQRVDGQVIQTNAPTDCWICHY